MNYRLKMNINVWVEYMIGAGSHDPIRPGHLGAMWRLGCKYNVCMARVDDMAFCAQQALCISWSMAYSDQSDLYHYYSSA